MEAGCLDGAKVAAGAHRLGVHVERLLRKEPPAKGARTGVSEYTLTIDGEPVGSMKAPGNWRSSCRMSTWAMVSQPPCGRRNNTALC